MGWNHRKDKNPEDNEVCLISSSIFEEKILAVYMEKFDIFIPHPSIGIGPISINVEYWLEIPLLPKSYSGL